MVCSAGLPDRLLRVGVQPGAQVVGDGAVDRPHAERRSATGTVRWRSREAGVAASTCATSSPHSDGTCDSTPMRARTSSPRLVSWVDSVVIADGHRPRPHGGAVVELRGADAEPVGLAAHLVERHQPGVAVEQAVLHRLGGDGAAQLLEPGGGLAAGSAPRRPDASGSANSGVSADGFGQCGRHHRRQRRVVRPVHPDVADSSAATASASSRVVDPGGRDDGPAQPGQLAAPGCR